MKRDAAKGYLFALALFSVGAVSYTISSAANSGTPVFSRPKPNEFGPVPNPYQSATGRHLIAYVIAASDCGWSTQPEVMSAISRLPSQLRDAHSSSFAQITVVGVILDSHVDEGIEFAKKLSREATPFDQLAIGGSWLNDRIVDLVWRGKDVDAVTPQVVLVSRIVDAGQFLEESRLNVKEDSVILTVSGSRDVVAWLAAGTPVAVNAQVSNPSDPSVHNPLQGAKTK